MKKLVILFTLFVTPLYAMETASIHEAAEFGNLAEVQRWLAQGIDINQQDDNGETPLHHAAYDGHQNVVDYLISHNANVNQPNHSGWTPLHYATRNNHQNIMKRLIDHRADINQHNRHNVTPLHQAALYGYQNIVEFLFNHGADIHQQDNAGWAPLHYATSGDFSNLIVFFITHGANPLIKVKNNLLNAIEVCTNHEMKKLIVREREKYFKYHLPVMPQFLRSRQYGLYTPSHTHSTGALFREKQEWEQYKKDHPEIIEWLKISS